MIVIRSTEMPPILAILSGNVDGSASADGHAIDFEVFAGLHSAESRILSDNGRTRPEASALTIFLHPLT